MQGARYAGQSGIITTVTGTDAAQPPTLDALNAMQKTPACLKYYFELNLNQKKCHLHFISSPKQYFNKLLEIDV